MPNGSDVMLHGKSDVSQCQCTGEPHFIPVLQTSLRTLSYLTSLDSRVVQCHSEQKAAVCLHPLTD